MSNIDILLVQASEFWDATNLGLVPVLGEISFEKSLILKFTCLGQGVLDIPKGYDQIDKYNGTMAHKFNHRFYKYKIQQSYVRS